LNQDGILFLGNRGLYYSGEAQGVGRPGLLDRRIRRLLVDRNGGVWAAASDQGLLYNSGGGESQWVTVDVVPGGAPVRTVAEFPDGSLWAAGDRLVVRSDDGGKTWTRVGTQDGLGSDIGALVQDEAGRVWAGAYQGGVSFWDGQTWHALQQ
jgi:ligand-binding sensor domain-containing protein